MNQLRSDLEQLLRRGGPPLEPLPGSELVIYGAGNTGRSVMRIAKQRGMRVAAFLDARVGLGKDLDDVPCLVPGAAEARRLAASGIPVVIAIFNYATDLGPVVQLLGQTGFTRIISYYEFYQHTDGSPHFWLTNRAFYREQVDEVLSGFDLFGDRASQQVYYDHIALRLTFDLQLLRQPETSVQYLLADLNLPKNPVRLIDGGAFTGDTIESFLKGGVEFAAVAAFEPDPDNFQRLAALARRHADRLGETVLMPCGLGARTEICSFHAGAGEGSAMTPAGETHIQVTSLDDVLTNFAPTFIKLDVEGAEPAALRGAAQTIATYHPQLAVCLYHSPEHLWRIPQLIRDLRPDYQFALRYYQYNGLELVLYAFTA